ncbi:MAG: hypothetical protein J0M07_00385 [Anaerolineae bacterium]|nr:hypothetical protein [Anaerolineae bacterium]
MVDNHTDSFLIPGTTAHAHLTYDRNGRLTSLTCGVDQQRTYVEQVGSKRVFAGGWVTQSEIVAGQRLLRQVAAGDDFWVETYEWDPAGRLILVDGVRVDRDERGRVSACVTEFGSWHYGYKGDHVAEIAFAPAPDQVAFARRVGRGADGRALRLKQDGRVYPVSFDQRGGRTDVPTLPANYHRDAWGRLWTITDETGAPIVTYLWDNYRCLGRIDGAPGDPLSAVFSLDPTGTPVRMIEQNGVTRIPRDAYGESLLTYERVPGLYGGTVYGNLHHYAARSFDPLSASFTTPDPLDGTAADPRRAGGYAGPLMVEHGASGPYALCQHDPITRADPTGAFSWWILITDFTWASQNNMLGLLGLDFIFNFWASLFSGNIGAFFDREFFYSEQAGTWGWRSDGVMGKITGGRAFAFQHQIWSPSHEFNVLDDARGFIPNAAFRPTHYGTILRGKPKDKDAFLLTADPRLFAAGMKHWTRAGGTAEAVIPGSSVPIFPSGGLHFDSPITDLRVSECTLTEIEPTGVLLSGNVGDRVFIDVAATGLGLRPDTLVLLTDATRQARIEDIAAADESAGRTRVYFKRDVPAIGPANVRLRGLTPSGAAENINHNAATPAEYLDVTGTMQPYAAGDPVRLNQNSAVMGSALIDRLEVKLTIDAPLTALTAPLSIFRARSLGVTTAGTLGANADQVDSASPPSVGDAVVIANAGGTRVAASVIERTGNLWRVDRSLQPALGAAGGAITWERLSVVLTPIGSKAGTLEADATLIYTAVATRTAPTSDFVVVRDTAGAQAVRAVSGAVYDAIVLATPLPGNTANPYSIERFNFSAPDRSNLTISRGQSFILNPAVPNDAVALFFHQYVGGVMATGNTVSEPGVGAIQFAVNGTRATAAVAGLTLAGHNALRPSAIVGFTTGTTTTPALITKVRVSVTLDRQLTLAANGLEAVPLSAVGWRYDGVPLPVPGGSLTAAVVTVKPRTSVPAANTRVQMPRFQAGDFVRVDYGAPAGQRIFRVGTLAGDAVPAVDGLTLGLSDDLAPAALPATVTVQRLEPGVPFPATGGSRIGIRGSAIPTAGTTTNRVAFDVWAGDTLGVNQTIAIVNGALAHPAVITAIDTIEVEFAALTPLANGNYTISADAPDRTSTVPGFVREGSTIVVTRQDLVSDTLRLVLAVPLKEGAARADGNLTGGTVIVPDESDDRELTRLDSLKAHELTHTRQWSMVGPLMLFGFPTFVLEGIVEAATEVEMPEFSAYVPATLVPEGSVRLLQIGASGAIDFNEGDKVQISWASAQPNGVTAANAGIPRTITLGPEETPNSNLFRVILTPDIVPVEVVNAQVRRHRADTDAWARTLDVLQVISAGGLMNFLGGAVYGGLFNLIGRGIYALVRLIGGQGKTYPAMVEGLAADAGKLLRVTDADGRSALEGASRIIVEKDDNKLVRSVVRISGEVVTLADALDVTGEVRVAPYSTFRPDSTFDWHQYYPASIPDLSRPATVQIDPASPGDTLSLDPFDRVQIVRGDATYGRIVTAVSGNRVDLNETLPGTETVFRIAKIGETDPIGNFDSVLMTNELGTDWLKWVFDPYSQLQYDLQPDPTSFAGVLARIGRYAFGAQSWSFIWASVLTIDRVHQAEHLARIEQAASSNSGDTYSPLGRLREEIAVVGDIARYWQVPLGGAREFDTYVAPGDTTPGNWLMNGATNAPGLQDAPGVNLQDTPRVMTSLRDATDAEDGDTDLNDDVRSDGTADPGNDVPDILFAKLAADPTVAAATDPDGFMPAQRGWIPTTPRMQRSTGMYVAFSRPGKHRVTVRNNVRDQAEAREAQEKGKGRQTIWYDKTVADIVAVVNGQPITAGATLTFVQTQRARIAVLPNTARRYALTLQRQTGGEVLRAPDPADPLVIEAGRVNGTEDVEISRLYAFNTTTGRYDHPALARHSVHLPTDIHIPVRLFSIEVVDTLPVRRALTLNAADISTELALNGTAFLLVPATIGPQGARITSATAGGAAVPVAPLQALIQPAPASIPADVQVFVGTGGVIQLNFTPALNVTAETDIEIQVEVGVGTFAQLKATLKLRP